MKTIRVLIFLALFMSPIAFADFMMDPVDPKTMTERGVCSAQPGGIC